MTSRSGDADKRLWPTPGRNQHRVAGPDVQGFALFAAESDLRLALGDSEHLMGGRVVVMEGKDAVPPAAAPPVFGEIAPRMPPPCRRPSGSIAPA